MIFDASNLSPVLFSIESFAIRWYALAYIAGFILGLSYLERLIKGSKKLTKKDLDNLLVWVVFGVILGGRFGYVFFYNLEYYLSHPLDIIKVWEGGMSFHGGTLGVILATYLFSYKHKFSFLQLTDLICAAVPIGLFFGRLANFVNNELWGKLTNGTWGVIFRDGQGLPRHPSQLYEAFLEGVILFIILAFVYKKKSDKAGFVSGLFLILYGLFRIIIEFFREPDVQVGYILEFLTMGQILSLPMIILGIYLVARKGK